MRLMMLVATLALPLSCLWGCNVAPKTEDRTLFVEEAREGLKHFESHVTGLTKQIRDSAGYAVFPGAGQWGIIFTGGSFGRGAVFTPNGTQIGWAAVNNFSLGLQAGGQGKKILIVFANADALNQFKQGLLTGKVGMDRVFEKGEFRTNTAWNPWFVPVNRRRVLDQGRHRAAHRTLGLHGNEPAVVAQGAGEHRV